MIEDFTRIKYGKTGRLVEPIRLYETFMQTKKFIFYHAKKDYPEQIVAVVTHMAPSGASVAAKYRGDRTYEVTNYCYYSELSKQILQSPIDYWFHGHMHDSNLYDIDQTRVVLNPRGYAGFENSWFDQELSIDLIM